MSKSCLFGIGVAWLLFVSVVCGQAAGMGMESFGPAGEHVSRQADWPIGVGEVLQHPARVYWNWVNGSERAYYAGDVAVVNELLALYSKVELAAHPVVILPGKLEAESFHGVSTPYVVQFDMPGKLQLGVRRRRGTATLYYESPRMILAVDSTLADRLDELQIPPIVTLQSSAIEVEKAIEFSGSEDPAVRREAIDVLGCGEELTPKIVAVFERAGKDDHASVQAAAKMALKRLATTHSSVDPELRKRVADFLKSRRTQPGEMK